MAKRKPDPNGWVMHSAAILERISHGETLRAVCRDLNLSESTIRDAVQRDSPKGFSAQYAQARLQQTHAMADEILLLADEAPQMIEGKFGPCIDSAWVQWHRLRVDSRKWLLSKINPQAYGEKVDVTSQGEKLQGVVVLPPVKE